jgi:Flp pilus assembly protein TadG
MKNKGFRWFSQKNERGSSTIELAIVFPILLLLFAGTAELGRLYSTYTTLAKATKLGARYLSNKIETVNTDPAVSGPVIARAKNLVVCGYEDCTGKTPIIPGLDSTNVSVTVPTSGALPPVYVTVGIQNYTFQPGVFNLAGPTGATSSAIYFSLQPRTTMRYMVTTS